MNLKWASLLDLYVGKPLLRLISLLPPYPKSIPINPDLKNILLIKFFGMGSILEATPLIKALKKHFPKATVDILTFSENEKIVKSLDLFGNVHVIDFRKNIVHFIKQTVHFIHSYRRKYSMIIDLEFFANFSALITNMLSSPYSMGFESFIAARNRSYSRTIIFDHSFHVRIVFLKFLDALSLENPNTNTISPIHIPNKKKSAALDKFPSLKDSVVKIAININSSDLFPKRRWPEESYQRLIALMKQDYQDLQIYLVGGKNDEKAVKSFYESLPDKKGIYITAGNLDILEFSYALTKMSCLISNDSGPAHIAEAMNVRLVCFFGPETPNLYGPLSKNNLVFYKNLFCSPCLNIYAYKKNKCKDNICLKNISAEDVHDKMKTFFKGFDKGNRQRP